MSLVGLFVACVVMKSFYVKTWERMNHPTGFTLRRGGTNINLNHHNYTEYRGDWNVMSDRDDNQRLHNLLRFQIFATDDEMGQLGCILAPVLMGAAFVLWWWGS